ncbi:unnamed protein product, partial [Laminaria digitata]
MYEFVTRITNTGTEPLPLCIEPYGMCLEIEPRHTFRLVTRSAYPGQWEVIVNQEELCLWAAASFTFDLFDDDELVFECNHPVPGAPANMTTRDFIGMVF